MIWIIGGLFVVGFLVFTYVQYQRAKNSWSEVASAHGLTLRAPGLMSRGILRGTYRGREIETYNEERSSGQSTQWFTVYETNLANEVPAGLELCDESLLSKLGKAIGAEDVEVGRKELDDAFVINGLRREKTRKFLDADRVETALTDLHEFESDVELKEGKLKLQHSGTVRSSDRLESYLDELVECADLLDDRAGRFDRPSPAEPGDRGDSETGDSDEPSDQEIDEVAEW